ncbi:UNVERIFIED_CONTAM: hypothetical protein HDU68_000288 [Siphonaria sp. JEL0065]|nr:hypothetical protein HDU68_000288 [Siphonaria sp. JEL0065]
MAAKGKKGKGKATPKKVQNEPEEDPEEYEVEAILNHRFNKSMCRWEYYVKWVGYDDEDSNTWEPYESFGKDLIDEYISDHADEINSSKKRKLSSAVSASSASSFSGRSESPAPIPATKAKPPLKKKSPRAFAAAAPVPSKTSSSTTKPRQESPKSVHPFFDVLRGLVDRLTEPTESQTAKTSRKSLAPSQSTSSKSIPESIRDEDSWEPYISRFKTISLVDPELKLDPEIDDYGDDVDEEELKRIKRSRREDRVCFNKQAVIEWNEDIGVDEDGNLLVSFVPMVTVLDKLGRSVSNCLLVVERHVVRPSEEFDIENVMRHSEFIPAWKRKVEEMMDTP